MWEFIFGIIVGTVGTIVGLVMFAAVAAAAALDTDRISERNKKR